MKNAQFIFTLILILTPITFLPTLAIAEEESMIEYRGYAKDLFQVIPATEDQKKLEGEDYYFLNLIHTRLNLKWYLSDNLTSALELRGQHFYGNKLFVNSTVADALGEDQGYYDLTYVDGETEGNIYHATIDRAWVEWSRESFQARFGRQRINWGLNLIWNPNDLFNLFQFADFDYEEKAGTDSIRLQYYPTATSQVEFAVAPKEESKENIAAALYKMSHWDTEFQFLIGSFAQSPVYGFGWAGYIGGISLRGEFSYFSSKDDDSGGETDENEGRLIGAISVDYTFSNGLYLLSEFLYNEKGVTGEDILLPSEEDYSAKNPTRAKYSFFTQVTREITPLLRGSFSLVQNPSDRSYFLSPSLDYSVITDLDFLFLAQLYGGSEKSEFGNTALNDTYTFRFKYSF